MIRQGHSYRPANAYAVRKTGRLLTDDNMRFPTLG